jgi:hypothetical protein
VKPFEQRLVEFRTAQAKAGKTETEAPRFLNRLRFDQSVFWAWNREPEHRSVIPSTWPAFVEACQKWGVPAGFRRTDL